MVSIVDVFYALTEHLSKSQVFCNEPMNKHTSFKIGGKADFYVIAKNIDEIKHVLNIVKKYNIPLTVIGNGTNILVLDSGIRGIVLKLDFKKIEVNNNIIIAGSSALLNMVCKIAKENNLSGLEFAFGIPGTIGGAVKMNAGAYGGEMKDVVLETTYITKDGNIKTISEHEFSYRNSIFSKLDVIILETTLALKKANKKEIEEKMLLNIKKRKESQPIELPNAGSTFKRGTNFITAQLIDMAGLKGYSIGGAEVSTKHAGFIVNKGNATADDILKLADYVKQQVYQKFNKIIELEIIVIGKNV